MAEKNPHLKPNWLPGQSGNPKGRPRSTVKADLTVLLGDRAAKRFSALSGADIDQWEQTVLAMSLDELKTLAKWEGARAYPKNLALAILNDMKNGKTATIDRLRERQYGKAVQKVELTGANGSDLLPARTLTVEEARQVFEKLENDY